MTIRIQGPAQLATFGLAALGGAAGMRAASNASARHAAQESDGPNPMTGGLLTAGIVGGGLVGGAALMKTAVRQPMRSAGMGVLAGTVAGAALHQLFAKPAIGALSGAPAGTPTPPAAPTPAPNPGSGRIPSPTPGAPSTATKFVPQPDDRSVRVIDVSKWQPEVDWTQVKSAGIGVAILRSSIDKDRADATYAAKNDAARAAGMIVGTYHFAKPGSQNRADVVADATAEAHAYLKHADIRSGDMVPVLDLEDSGGLNKDELARWTRTFLDTVRDERGVTPMLYTGPAFWATHVNDTLNIAKDYPLWLAHYGTETPRIPDGWPEWTMWQTGTGGVPGIPGEVDINWLRDIDQHRVK